VAVDGSQDETRLVTRAADARGQGDERPQVSLGSPALNADAHRQETLPGGRDHGSVNHHVEVKRL
jgi:hypothetical protein